MIFLLTDLTWVTYDARRWMGGGGCVGWGSARLSGPRTRTQRTEPVEGGAYGSQEESDKEQGQEEGSSQEGRSEEEEVVSSRSRLSRRVSSL